MVDVKQILPIIAANLRKAKGQAASLLVFVLVSALLLNLGLLLMIGFGSFFDTRAEELHTPHLVLLEEQRLFSQSQLRYLKEYPGVKEVEYESSLLMMADISYNNGEMPAFFLFVDSSGRRQMNDLSLVEGTVPTLANEICLPYMFKTGGYELGDSFRMKVGDKTLYYNITGFTEEIMLGSINNQYYQVYLSNAGFIKLLNDMPEFESTVIRVRLEDPAGSETLRLDATREFLYSTQIEAVEFAQFAALDYPGVVGVRTMMSSITSIILVVFAALIVIISLLVIRFRIRNSIEESMTNIGALKAVGYTGSQLIRANLLQFGGIAAIGIVAGIAASYALLPLVSAVLEQQTALRWQQGFDSGIASICFCSILLAVALVTWLSARQIRALAPLVALRQGLVTHSFKRNHFSLAQSRGPLTWLLALKSALQAKGQMTMVAIIVTAVSFAAVAGISVYDNLGVNPENFASLLGGELPDAAFYVKTPADAKLVRLMIEKDENVRKVFYNQDVYVMIGDLSIVNMVAEDFSLYEGDMLYEGQYPRHNNEIALSGSLARYYNLEIGDTAKVTQGGRTLDYLIVGYVQSVNNGGLVSAMTIEAYQRLQPSFEASDLYVYLYDSTLTDAHIKTITARYDAVLYSAINLVDLMTAQLSVYGDIFYALALVLVLVTALVIFMVLYMMLKTMILRRRRELGIKKALGFTTFQLMNELALYFIPVIVFGIALGGALGVISFNPIFVALSHSMGIMTASMPAPLGTTVVVCALLAALAYVFAMLIAWRIRKISAYALVTE